MIMHGKGTGFFVAKYIGFLAKCPKINFIAMVTLCIVYNTYGIHNFPHHEFALIFFLVKPKLYVNHWSSGVIRVRQSTSKCLYVCRYVVLLAYKRFLFDEKKI